MNETALAIVKRAQSENALVFINQENFQSQVDLYRTEATIIKADPSEFHSMQGKFMPNRAVTDRISEATGIQFVTLPEGVRAETRDDEIAGRRTVYVGFAQGEVRMPDGSMRKGNVEEYEFDPTLRAMLDKNVSELNEATRKAIARTVLEYTKVARQRASTGARLRVIRAITGMPVNFSKEDISRPMVFTRIVQNTAAMLATPEGRTMAYAQALGTNVNSILYGNKPVQAIADSPEMTPAETAPENLRDANEPEAGPEPAADTASLAAQASGGKSPEDQEFEDLSVTLEALLESNKDVLNRDTRTGNPYKLAKDELGSFAATIDSRKAMTAKIENFLEALKKGATA